MTYSNRINLLEASKDRFIDKNPNLNDEQKAEIKAFFNKHSNLDKIVPNWQKEGLTWKYEDFFNAMLPYLDKDTMKDAINNFCKMSRNLYEDQKNIIKNFFNKFPDEAKKVNWADYDLTYEDFINVMLPLQKDYLLPQEKFKDLVEGEDYINFGSDDSFNYFLVKTFKASYVLASNNVPPKTWSTLPGWYREWNWINDYPKEHIKTNEREGDYYGGAKWCISMHHTPTYWNDYTSSHDYIFVIANKKGVKEKKIAVQLSKSGNIETYTNYGFDTSFNSATTRWIRDYIYSCDAYKEYYGK